MAVRMRVGSGSLAKSEVYSRGPNGEPRVANDQRPVSNDQVTGHWSLVIGPGCYNTLMSSPPDVLIVGGGVIGLTTAYYLARDGVLGHRPRPVDARDGGLLGRRRHHPAGHSQWGEFCLRPPSR